MTDSENRKSLKERAAELLKLKIVRQTCSSLFATLIDLSLYWLFDKLLEDKVTVSVQVLIATVLSRVISATVNYLVNKRFVFQNDGPTGKTVVRFACIQTFVMLMSWRGVTWLVDLTGLEGILRTCLKMAVDAMLFFVNFFVQKLWVFA